jgi:hypothetical protein
MEVCTMHAQQPVSYSNDPRPVRPGTSDALTARTIDATIHPPIVRAQESVAAAVPRIAKTVSSPQFLTMVALTLVLVWMVVRLKSRVLGLALSAVLVMTLTSFRPVQIPDQPRDLEARPVTSSESSHRWERPEYSPPPPPSDPAPYVFTVPTRPHEAMPDMGEIRIDEEELRAAVEELRSRIEEELRRRGDHRDHGDGRRYTLRAARWIHGLGPSVQELVVVGQQALAEWDRGRRP